MQNNTQVSEQISSNEVTEKSSSAAPMMSPSPTMADHMDKSEGFGSKSFMAKAYDYQFLTTITMASATKAGALVATLSPKSCLSPWMSQILNLNSFVKGGIKLKFLNTAALGLSGAYTVGQVVNSVAAPTLQDLSDAPAPIFQISEPGEVEMELKPAFNADGKSDTSPTLMSVADFLSGKYFPSIAVIAVTDFSALLQPAAGAEPINCTVQVLAKFSPGTTFVHQGAVKASSNVDPDRSVVNPQKLDLDLVVPAESRLFTDGKYSLQGSVLRKDLSHEGWRMVPDYHASVVSKGTPQQLAGTKVSADCHWWIPSGDRVAQTVDIELQADWLKDDGPFDESQLDPTTSAAFNKDDLDVVVPTSLVTRSMVTVPVDLSFETELEEPQEVFTSAKLSVVQDALWTGHPATDAHCDGEAFGKYYREGGWRTHTNDDVFGVTPVMTLLSVAKSWPLLDGRDQQKWDIEGSVRISASGVLAKLDAPAKDFEFPLSVDATRVDCTPPGLFVEDGSADKFALTHVNVGLAPCDVVSVEGVSPTVATAVANLKPDQQLDLPPNCYVVECDTRLVPTVAPLVVSTKERSVLPPIDFASALGRFYDPSRTWLLSVVDKRFGARVCELIYSGPNKTVMLKSGSRDAPFMVARDVVSNLRIQGATDVTGTAVFPECSIAGLVSRASDAAIKSQLWRVPRFHIADASARYESAAATAVAGGANLIDDLLRMLNGNSQSEIAFDRSSAFQKELVGLIGTQAMQQLMANLENQQKLARMNGEYGLQDIAASGQQSRLTQAQQSLLRLKEYGIESPSYGVQTYGQGGSSPAASVDAKGDAPSSPPVSATGAEALQSASPPESRSSASVENAVTSPFQPLRSHQAIVAERPGLRLVDDNPALDRTPPRGAVKFLRLRGWPSGLQESRA